MAAEMSCQKLTAAAEIAQRTSLDRLHGRHGQRHGRRRRAQLRDCLAMKFSYRRPAS